MGKRQRALIVAACGLGALFVVAFAVEFALRTWGGDRRDEGFPRSLFVADATRGYVLAPGSRVAVQRVHPFEIAVNESGYRDRSWRDVDARPRVLFVGSSALFG